jgi:hypothetical protein
VTPPRLTPELEAKIRAELRTSGRVSALNIAYLLDELDAVRKELDAVDPLHHRAYPCRHIWEADDQGVQCCALCGVRAA